jgi:hypothetical protein
MSCTCDCCTGAHVTTPASEENRPGLRRINHHPGTYATFFETMQARMASSDFPELAALRARGLGDPSIALCDAWAITADVLSFYQDRIANEGYLRTATERTSLLQLGRLTGYQLRPGVSASAYPPTRWIPMQTMSTLLSVPGSRACQEPARKRRRSRPPNRCRRGPSGARFPCAFAAAMARGPRR